MLVKTLFLFDHFQVTLPRLKAMTWSMADQDTELTDPVAVINLKVSGQEVQFLYATHISFFPFNLAQFENKILV